MALVIPATIGVLGWLLLHVSSSATSGTIGTAASYFAAPALVAIGGPLANSALRPVALGLSLVMWLVAGFLAARRATRNPFAIWSDFWRHYAWLLAGIWFGVILAIGLATLWAGPDLIELI